MSSLFASAGWQGISAASQMTVCQCEALLHAKFTELGLGSGSFAWGPACLAMQNVGQRGLQDIWQGPAA